MKRRAAPHPLSPGNIMMPLRLGPPDMHTSLRCSTAHFLAHATTRLLVTAVHRYAHRKIIRVVSDQPTISPDPLGLPVLLTQLRPHLPQKYEWVLVPCPNPPRQGPYVLVTLRRREQYHFRSLQHSSGRRHHYGPYLY